MARKFRAELQIIGVNPFVFIPEKILRQVFRQAGKDKGHIPVCGSVNSKPYKQTLVKYSGEWRLYINATMLKNSPKRIGEIIVITIEYDPEPREIQVPGSFLKALTNNPDAKRAFEGLSNSRKQEIVRYLANLKSAEALSRNVNRAIRFLLGNEKFVGRDKP